MSDTLLQAIILLFAAVFVVPLFRSLGMGAVLGFLAAGMLVGPTGLGFITEVKSIQHFAELGVVFLLFIIGIELKPQRLWLLRKQVFGMGSAQVLLSGAVLVGALLLAGYRFEVSLLLGLGLALSSTAFVLQLLTERKDLGSNHGRAAFAVLLLQDLAVVPLLAMVPMLSATGTTLSSNPGLAFLESIGVLLVVIVVGRLLLRPVLHQITLHGSSEIFIATALLLVLGTATLIEHAGMSMAMGAFIAGLLIADSEFRHQIMADIQPFRAILLGLFFMSVGMAVDLAVLVNSPLKILLMLLGLILIKAATLWLVARLFGLSQYSSLRVGLLLAQGGEFAFVLFGAGVMHGVLNELIYQEAILVVALSMAITPLLARPFTLGGLTDENTEHPVLPVEAHEEHPEVIVAGFGRMGQRICTLLKQAGVPYVAIEQRAKMVARGRKLGHSVYFGDANRSEVLHSSGVDHAKLMIVAIDNVELVEKLVGDIRRMHPQLPVFARGHSHSRCERLMELGATGVASENLEASLQLSRFALYGSGVDELHIDELIDEYRTEYYRSLRYNEERKA